MLAGEVSSTRSKQTFEIGNVDVPLNTTTGLPYHVTQFILRYKGSISVDWGDGNKSYSYSTYSVVDRFFSHTYSIAYSGVIKIKGNINSINYVKMYTPVTATMSQIKKLTSLEEFHCGSSGRSLPGITNDIWSFDVNNLPSKLNIFDLGGRNVSYSKSNLYGTVSSATVVPPNLTYIQIFGSSTLTGDIKWFFGTTASVRLPNLTTLIIGGSNKISGDISTILRISPTMSAPVGWVSPNGQPYFLHQLYEANAGPTLTYLLIDGSNTVTGDIISLGYFNLVYLNIAGSTGFNTVSGNKVYGDIIWISFIPEVYIDGANRLSGDLYGLSHNPGLPGLLVDTVKHFRISGYNTITGDIMNFPASIISIDLTGLNSVYGDIGNLPSKLQTFAVDGVRSGGYAGSPGWWAAVGRNTISGDLANLYSVYASGGLTTINSFVVGGKNTITGDVSYILPTLTVFTVAGNNSISGAVQNIPEQLIRFNLTNSSVGLTGDIGYLQCPNGDSRGNLEAFTVAGTNSISGNLAELFCNPNPLFKTSISYFYLSKNTTKISYTRTTGTWKPNQISELWLYPSIGGGLTTNEVDNLLIDLAGSDNGSINLDGGASNKAKISIAGNNAKHSALSNVAISRLLARGCLVIYNI